MTSEPGQGARPEGQPIGQPTGPDAWRAAGRHRVGGGLVLGLILLLVGGYFLLRQAVPSVDADRVWPWVAIAIGVVLVVIAFLSPED